MSTSVAAVELASAQKDAEITVAVLGSASGGKSTLLHFVLDKSGTLQQSLNRTSFYLLQAKLRPHLAWNTHLQGDLVRSMLQPRISYMHGNSVEATSLPSSPLCLYKKAICIHLS
jgi:hypothetical protein